MYLPRNTFVFVVVLFRHNYVAAAVKALNITLKDLEIMNKTYLQLPGLENTNTNTSTKHNDDNFRQKIKRMYDELEVVEKAKDLPPKKIYGMYTQFLSDFFVPTYQTSTWYPIHFAQLIRKMYLKLKEP